MKALTVFLTLFLFSYMTQAQDQNNSYSELWKQVEKLENEALTKSALKVVETVFVEAKKEDNSPQIVKALLYTSKYALTLQEDAQLKIVNDFKAEIEKADFPTKNVLESYLANLYWQYFQQNRYQFYNRTETETKVNSIDFRTWDLTTLFEEIDIHFKASLADAGELQKIEVGEFDPILNEQKHSEIYRPTLFDLLAHTALQFYKTDENSITRPADKFEIDDPNILCEANAFAQLKIDARDDTSLQATAIHCYQDLVKFHLSDTDPKALADVDIERLNYIHQKAVFSNKDRHYLEVLQNSAENFKQSEVAALYRYEIAKLHHEQGSTYQPLGNGEHRWKQKEALEICEAVIAEFPKSRGAEKCRALKADILSKNIQMTLERHIPINKPSRILVNYKNLDGLSLTAYKASKNDIEKLNRLYPESKQLAFIKKLPTEKTWEASLKKENDYKQHSIEILLPELKNGQYILLAQPKDGGNGTFAYAPVQVTDLAVVETQMQGEHRFQVIDRNNGQPKEGAKLQLTYQENYDRGLLNKTFTTDKNGVVTIPSPSKTWTSVQIKTTHSGDTAHFGEYYIQQKYNSRILHNVSYNAFLFTDRSIYRPGQTVYFKGIMTVKTTNDATSVQPNTQVTVMLRDVNYQEVAQQEFLTNEFGSFSGEFVLPSSGLTGNFSIQVTSKAVNLSANTNFSVEEYKRPKFKTSFEPVTETYRVNDSITVKGTATAYAGSNITDAKVGYRVKRVVYFPRWYYWSRPYYNTNEQEIAHGETTSDASGHYEIDFKAIPDNSVPKENQPTFSYEITADVTDINGETRSATTVVQVGYHAMSVNIGLQQRLQKGEKDTLSIFTTNLNGQPVDAKGTLKLYKLQAPEYVLRDRPWNAPDYKNWTKEEFKKRFPHEAYRNESDPKNWKKRALVWEGDFDTGKTNGVALKAEKKWDSGKYLLELETTDKFGQQVTEKAMTTVVDEDETKLPDNQLFDIQLDQSTYKIGEKVKVTVASTAKNLVVTVTIEKDRKVMETRTISLSDGSKSFSVPVTEADLGGFAINYSFSAFNGFKSGSMTVPVPYPVTDLEIETVTFRDKLNPSAEETWSFKIKGPKGDKVTAELLASMYDASLDAFRGHYWNASFNYRPTYYSNSYHNAYHSFGTEGFRVYNNFSNEYSYTPQYYDSFDWFGLHFGYRYGALSKRSRMMRAEGAPLGIVANEMEEDVALDEVVLGDAAAAPMSKADKEANRPQQQSIRDEQKEAQETSFGEVAIRKNLQETAFFFPQLQTDTEGNVSFSFTTPEALTQWKLQLLAHTKTAQSAYTEMTTVTQKELMVIPNAPRFLREGDEITISTKISNLTDKKLSGRAKLQLVDAVSGQDISTQLLVSPPVGESEGAPFSVDSLGNAQVSWRLKIPKGLQAVQYTVLAKAGDFSDGEQNVLPVLTNRMLVTETLPMWVRSNQTKTFELEKLREHTSTTLSHHKLTLEVTSNPAWYAVQALPYLMEYPYECNEQTFAKYYANTLASHIANSNPRIKEVFDQWRNSDALLSNLEKKQELKSLLIQETPWLRDAQSETEQKKRIALLFDLNKMKNEQTNALNKLQQNQMSSGAWPWFKGGRANRYITQHIVTGLGHLKHLNVTLSAVEAQENNMLQKAIAYLDAEFVKEYEQMKKYAANLNDDHLSPMQIQYLYMRSFFKEVKTSKKVTDIMGYYKGQAQKYWPNRRLYLKGMLVLVLHRMDDSATANKILRSLKENSITNEELGMYWKENTASWYWYQAPIETQALMIEAFGEIENDVETIDNLKVWLLKNKQTNQWKTTKATTEAVYALLLQGSDWLSVTEAVDVLVGDKKINLSELEDVKVEAGTGYFKTSWDGSEVEPKMAEVQLTKKGEGIAWGALYWQYFEDLDKITSAETPLKLKKKLFLKKNTDTGEQISEITPETDLKVGDLVRVRIELRANRDMEFIHMKDMRAAGFEPVNVISRYKWQDGLGYYESTKDASTNFFFDYLPKGVYVFEYDLRVNNAGDFSNGITTIQSIYAPEFSSHSEGVRVSVRSKQ